MDLLYRARARRETLATIPSAIRKAGALDQLLEVSGVGDELRWGLDFGACSEPGVPRLRPPLKPLKHRDEDLAAALNGEGLRLLSLQSVAAIGITELRCAGALPSRVEAKVLRTFFKQPELAKVERLDLRGVGLGAASKHLAKSPHLGALRELDVVATKMDLSVLGETEALPHLEELHLGGEGHTAEELAAALENPHLPRLCRLRVDSRCIAGGLGGLAEHPRLAAMRSLAVRGGAPVPTEVWASLLEQGRFERLVELDVMGGPAEDTSLRVLRGEVAPSLRVLEIGAPAGSPSSPLVLPALRELRLHVGSEDALLWLAQQDGLSQLDSLHLDLSQASSFTGAGFEALYGHGALQSLGTLSLQLHGAMSPAAMSSLLAIPDLPKLGRLQLRSLPVDAPSFAALVRRPVMRHLHHLCVYGTVGPEGATALANADLDSLRVLELPGGKLGRGVAALFESSLCEGLQALDLTGSTLCEEDVDALLSRPQWPSLVELRATVPPRVPEAKQRALAEATTMPQLLLLYGLQLPPKVSLRKLNPMIRLQARESIPFRRYLPRQPPPGP